jgi:hypothetical protein
MDTTTTSAVICGKISGEGKRDLGPKGRQSLAMGRKHPID